MNRTLRLYLLLALGCLTVIIAFQMIFKGEDQQVVTENILAKPQFTFVNFAPQTEIEIINRDLSAQKITINNTNQIVNGDDLSSKTTFFIQTLGGDKIEIDWVKTDTLRAQISGLPPRTALQWAVNDKNLERIPSDWAGRLSLNLPEYQKESRICLKLLKAEVQEICHGINAGGLL